MTLRQQAFRQQVFRQRSFRQSLIRQNLIRQRSIRQKYFSSKFNSSTVSSLSIFGPFERYNRRTGLLSEEGGERNGGRAFTTMRRGRQNHKSGTRHRVGQISGAGRDESTNSMDKVRSRLDAQPSSMVHQLEGVQKDDEEGMADPSD